MTSSDTFVPAVAPQDGVWGTVGGRPVTEADVARLVANAEAGFPGTKPRRAGRPLQVGSQRAEVVQFRLDPERLRLLDAHAKRTHTSRSDVIRRAIDRELAAA
jgi:hypothetical protein